jgi:DNA-directed RNA polymerase subunit RPC12/RpoP
MQTQQHCPVCGNIVTSIPRYPRYVCADCATKASSAEGRRLEFFNTSLGGGYVARYADTKESYQSHECFIDGMRCYANEGRFGGVVIELATESLT